MPGSVRLHRVLVTTPDKVYRAFIDPDAYARWIPPNGFTGKVHEMDPKVGGRYRMSFTNFTTGNGHSFGGEYKDLQSGQRVQYKSIFDDPALAGDLTGHAGPEADTVAAAKLVASHGADRIEDVADLRGGLGNHEGTGAENQDKENQSLG